MQSITIRPALGHDFNVLQAMSCNGGDGPSCYPGFVTASHKFFVAATTDQVIGFICAYASQEKDNTRYVQLHEPYLYSRFRDQGIEDRLKVAVLAWGEQKLNVHFFKEDPFTLHPITPNEYLRSLKYNLPAVMAEVHADPENSQEMPVPQEVFIPSQAYTPA